MIIRLISLVASFMLISGCGFHFQGAVNLAPPLHHMYLQTPDPYGVLSRSLQDYLKTSHVELVQDESQAETVLVILQDSTYQELISVNGTQQTRQYNLRVVVKFGISDAKGRVLVPEQTLEENQPITIQSDQVLGSSNQVNAYYQKMRRSIAAAIIQRIASAQISQLITYNIAHYQALSRP